MTDTHGYHSTEASPSATDVIATLYTSATDSVTTFLAHLGFVPFGGESRGWMPLRGDVGAGLIGLFDVPAGDERDGTVEIGFETAEPLDSVRARLVQADHPLSDETADDYAPHLTLVDPDGQRAEINVASK